MKKIIKQNKGITLIALIVTIIILIILAGITINILFSSDGIVEKTQGALDDYSRETTKEQLELIKVPAKLNEYTLNLDNYMSELEKVKDEYKIVVTERNRTNAEVVVDGKYKFLILDKENGEIEIIYDGTAIELTLSETSGTITYPETKTFEVLKNPTGGILSVKSDNEDIAKATINGNVVTLEPKGLVGTTSIIVISEATTSANPILKAKYELTVNAGTIKIEAIPYVGSYDGQAHDALTNVTVTPSDATVKYALDDGEFTEEIPKVTGANTYTIAIEAAKTGYKTVIETYTVTVGKANASSGNLTLSEASGTITYPETKTFTVNKNASQGTLSVKSSNENIVIASIDESGKVTIVPKAITTDGQKAVITVTSAATPNYEEQTAIYEVTVNRGTISLTVVGYTGEYDGKAHNAITSVNVTPTDATIKYALGSNDLSTTMPQITNVGKYTVSVEASKPGYKTNSTTEEASIVQTLYDVTYKVDTSTTYKEQVKKGDTCLSPKTFTPTKSGYTFVGWRENSTASSSVLTSKTMGTSAITLYAVFKKDITVTYYNNSTTAATSTKQAYYNNGNVSNPSFTLTQASKSGWIARGWSTGTAGNSSITYNNATAFTRSSNVTLYGMYQQTITINYYTVSDATKKTATGTRYYNSGKNVYVNPKFTINPVGYGNEWTFRGWTTSTAADASVTYSSISNREFDSNKTLYILIQRPVTLTYNGNGATGGSVASETKYVYLNSYNGNTIKNPTFTLKANGYSKTAYSFSKWALGSASGTQYAAGASVTLSSNTTFFATWQTSSVTIISNGNVLQPSLIVGNTGTASIQHTTMAATAATNTELGYFGASAGGLYTGGRHECAIYPYADVTITLDSSLIGRQCTLVGYYNYSARWHGITSAYIKNGNTTLMNFSGNNEPQTSSSTFTLNSNTINMHIEFKCDNDQWGPSGHIGIRSLVIN